LKLEVGQPFPSQSKDAIRLLAPAFGVHDGATKRIADLPFVSTLLIPDEAYAAKIVCDKIPLDEVMKALGGDDDKSANAA
jgi:hypothetical protein